MSVLTQDSEKTDKQLVRSRRRFVRRQRRRQLMAWRYVVALVLLGALICFALWAVYLSSWLSVTGTDISGNTSLSDARIRTLAEVPTGGPLVRVDLAAIEARVAAQAEVKSVDVSREWPHQVRIEVTERVPVAVVTIGTQLRAMDGDGVVFGGYRMAPPGLPRIQPASGLDPLDQTAALKESAAVLASLPTELSSQVDHVEVGAVDDVELLLTAGKRVVWGSSADSASKAEVLSVLLQQDAKVYDVSVPGRPVTSD